MFKIFEYTVYALACLVIAYLIYIMVEIEQRR
jgi:hypothetical protein